MFKLFKPHEDIKKIDAADNKKIVEGAPRYEIGPDVPRETAEFSKDLKKPESTFDKDKIISDNLRAFKELENKIMTGNKRINLEEVGQVENEDKNLKDDARGGLGGKIKKWTPGDNRPDPRNHHILQRKQEDINNGLNPDKPVDDSKFN